ncbi:MAG: undecaprenyl-diphosphate phosphatase [Acidobacteriota bacterium]
MDPLHAIILGLIQGITEFLPISSSAHLILAPYLFGWDDQGLAFDIVVNAGTLLAALLYFRDDLRRAIAHVGPLRDAASRTRPGVLFAVAIGTVPVVIVGLLFYDFFATKARNPQLIAWTSIIFALALAWADHTARGTRPLERVRRRDAITIGLAQAAALLPGTSRSGITLTAGLMLGLERTAAARFSFLLAIPVGLTALLKDLIDILRGEALGVHEPLALALGFVAAAISAYAVIGGLLAWMRRHTLNIFVVYRIALGIALLIVFGPSPG